MLSLCVFYVSIFTLYVTNADDGSGASSVDKDLYEILEHHNKARQNLSLPPLTWDTELALAAQEITDNCTWLQGFSTADSEIEYYLDTHINSWTPSELVRHNWEDTRIQPTEDDPFPCCKEDNSPCCSYFKALSASAKTFGCGSTYCEQYIYRDTQFERAMTVACLHDPRDILLGID